MNRVYHSNHNIVYSCKYHIVFCPKYRRKVLVNGVDVRLKELISSIADENKFEVIEMEIMPDHVHLLLEVDPQFGIHKAVKTIRGKTSRILRQEFHWLTTKLPTLWTNSYFCSTVGGAPLEIVKQYKEMETYTLGYKFRIYPNATQARLIHRTLGCARFVYNHFLAVRRDQWNANRKSIDYTESSRLLTDLKKREETAWLSEVDSMALQEALRNLDRAFQNFFDKRARYPRFKSKHSHAQSYRTRNQSNGVRIVGKRIKLPKIGLVRIKQSREFSGRILSATVSRTASGKYFVSLCVEQDKAKLLRPNAGGQIGIDVGIREFYTDSNGNTVENPKPLKKLLRKLKREQRRLSRKLPRSQNRGKARVRLARVHERIANIRKDFLHKCTTRLARENQTAAVEHLNVKGMLKNHRLAQAISDVSWSEFFRQLAYKMELRGGELLKVETFYPSSQTCSVCGYQNTEVKNLGVREWTCPQCGAHHDRDHNAAKNILRRALENKAKAA